MKPLQLFIFIFLAVPKESILAAPLNQLKSSKPTTITLNTAVEAPFTTTTHDGFLDELATIIYKKIGYRLLIEKLPAERALRLANGGLIDGEIIRVAGMNKIYPNLVPIPEPMIKLSFVVFSKKNKDLNAGWPALAHKELAYILGWKIFENKVPKTALVTKTRDSQELFSLLQKNRIDYVLYYRWGGFYLINKLNLNDIQLHLPVLAKKEMFMYLHNKHKSIIPQLTAALVQLKKNGTYQRLIDKHLMSLKSQ